MEKSHVAMEQRLCLVCGRHYETGSILLDKRMSPVFGRYAVTGWGLDPEHQKLFNDGYVAFVGINEHKSGKEPDGSIKPDHAYRTGLIAHVKREVLPNLIKTPIADDLPFIFCEDSVIKALGEMQTAGK